jgi:hypothetical protein
MKQITIPALGCISLMALGLAVSTGSAYADDPLPNETTVTSDGSDPVDTPDAGTGEEPVVVEDTPVVDDPNVEYDPVIAQSGAPEVQKTPAGEETRSSRAENDEFWTKKPQNGARRSVFGSNSPWRDWLKERATQ